ncbi:hypothetical protein LEP3755_13050 [Leptolyngbya sp. NIES-3755]|nr:hypothetical protein LEP3755_13050 [Leptolyngbya sp. NIES-3755]
MTKFAAKLAIVSALILAPMSLPAMSQTGTGTGTGTGTTGTGTTAVDTEYHQEGRNGYWGLLGLLGLFGLLGRKSKRDEYSATGTTAYRDPADASSTRDRY